jgi:hypothetical protein
MTAATSPATNSAPPIKAPKRVRSAPKIPPCIASDRVAAWCATCQRPVDGPVHIDSETLKLFCSQCCLVCARKRGPA